MAIDIPGLFTRLGKLGKVAYLTHGHQSQLAAAYEDALDGYPNDHAWIAPLAQISDSLVNSATGLLPNLSAAARRVLLGTVADDVPSVTSLDGALRELVRQMVAAPASVKASTLGVTVTPVQTLAGNGFAVANTVGSDGLPLELVVPEVARLVNTGRGFQYQGEPVSDVWRFDSPVGSGSRASIPNVSASGRNLLTNGTFADWASAGAMPAGWTLAVGTIGTDFARSATAYASSYAAQLIAGTSTLTSIIQPITGLALETSYAIGFQMRRVSSAVSAGVLRVSLTDGSGTILQNAQGAAQSKTINLTGLTTSYAPQHAFFQTGRTLPGTVRIRFDLTTALAGGDVLLDWAAMRTTTRAYRGGPELAIFDGSTPFLAGDGWDVAATNNWGGSTHGATFQLLFDRFFGTRSAGITLPSAGSPTIADALITA